MITYQDFSNFLNAGLPDATGGILSTIAISLFNRARSFFNNTQPTSEEFDNLLSTNQEFREIISDLSHELNGSKQVINNNAEIGKQINIANNFGNIQM